MMIEDPDADFKLYLSGETGCVSKSIEAANVLGIISTTDSLSNKISNSPLGKLSLKKKKSLEFFKPETRNSIKKLKFEVSSHTFGTI